MVGCKILRWCETFTVYGSLIVLLEIGFDRYFKICRPLMMVSLSKIRFLCAMAVVLAALVSIPVILLYGIDPNHTSVPDVYGFDCSISEDKNTTFQKVFYSVLGGLFLF
nr:neuromedin-U receptor 2-like [Biomphalaria glabrata]